MNFLKFVEIRKNLFGHFGATSPFDSLFWCISATMSVATD